MPKNREYAAPMEPDVVAEMISINTQLLAAKKKIRQPRESETKKTRLRWSLTALQKGFL